MQFRLATFRDLDHTQVRRKKLISAYRASIVPRQTKETVMTDLALTTVKDEALNADELDRISGGIIIVSGLQNRFTSPLDRVALNPQPLPPRYFSFGQ
jgi:hypothetical protein